MMRTRLLIAGLALVVCVSSLAWAQENNQPRRGGRGRGGFGFTPAMLVGNAAVKEELKMTDEQKEKLKALPDPMEFFVGVQDLSDEERAKKRKEFEDKTKEVIDGALDEGQRKRLNEILLQARGGSALNDPEIAKALELTEEQTKQIKELAEARPQRPAGGNAPGGFDLEAFRKAREEREAKFMAVLNDDQKKKFEEMKGEKFDLAKLRPMGGFGQPRPGGNN